MLLLKNIGNHYKKYELSIKHGASVYPIGSRGLFLRMFELKSFEKKIETKMVEKKREIILHNRRYRKKKLKFKIKLMGSAHRITGPDRSFVTVGRSLTVANGFSPLKNGCFITPFGVGFGDPLLPA